jgi:hypothetical protein
VVFCRRAHALQDLLLPTARRIVKVAVDPEGKPVVEPRNDCPVLDSGLLRHATGHGCEVVTLPVLERLGMIFLWHIMADSTEGAIGKRWQGVCDRYDSSDLQHMSVEDRRFFLVYDMLGQVGNGGLGGYFGNSTGHLATQTADALDVLGANRSAEAIRRAIAHFPEGFVPINWDDRRDVIDGLDDSVFEDWNKLSKVIYEEERLTTQRLSELPSN